MPLHKRWFSRTVRSDEGYELALMGGVPRGEKLRYSEGYRSVTVVGEQALIVEGKRKRWGYHFALDQRHLRDWDDGSEISLQDRGKIQDRIRSLLEFMKVPRSLDTK